MSPDVTSRGVSTVLPNSVRPSVARRTDRGPAACYPFLGHPRRHRSSSTCPLDASRDAAHVSGWSP